MHKFLFVCFTITALFFVVYGQNESNVTLTTTTKPNKTIAISSNSVKIVVKCRDTNSLLTNINLDNGGSVSMNNDETDEKTMDSSIFIVFDTCRQRTNGLLSLFKSFSSGMINNDPQFSFSGMSYSKTFRINLDGEKKDEQMTENATTPTSGYETTPTARDETTSMAGDDTTSMA